jgi:hypothetical protein
MNIMLITWKLNMIRGVLGIRRPRIGARIFAREKGNNSRNEQSEFPSVITELDFAIGNYDAGICISNYGIFRINSNYGICIYIVRCRNLR